MSHYFYEDKSLSDKKKTINYMVNGLQFKMETSSGIFSKDRLDYATNLLLENLSIPNAKDVLDLGCGYGPIGAYLHKVDKSLNIDMIDTNDKAIELAKGNIKSENVKIYSSDGFSNVNKKFDAIITNPPIRIGKEKLYKILKESYSVLNQSGELWFVMNKKHGVNSAIKILEEIFDYTEVIEKKKGFYIVKMIKLCNKMEE